MCTKRECNARDEWRIETKHSELFTNWRDAIVNQISTYLVIQKVSFVSYKFNELFMIVESKR